MLYFVKIAAVLKLLAPYEDLIIDGSLAHDAVSSSHNCIISAMRMGEVALLGVTADEHGGATGEEAVACARKALLPPDELGYVRTP